MTKKFKNVISEEFSFDGVTIESIITTLSAFPKNSYLDFQCDYEGDTHFHIVTTREETDEECKQRIAYEEQIKANNLAAKRRQLAALKLELGE